MSRIRGTLWPKLRTLSSTTNLSCYTIMISERYMEPSFIRRGLYPMYASRKEHGYCRCVGVSHSSVLSSSLPSSANCDFLPPLRVTCMYGLAGSDNALQTIGISSFLPRCSTPSIGATPAAVALPERPVSCSQECEDHSGELMAAKNRPFPTGQG